MNATYLIAALVLAGSPLANAASPTAGVTRAQVYAEIVQARANGELPLSEANYLPYHFAAATPITREQATAEPSRTRDGAVTRAQVRAELNRARAAGEIPETEADNDVGRAALRSGAK